MKHRIMVVDDVALLAPSETHLKIVDNRTVRLFQGEKVNFLPLR